MKHYSAKKRGRVTYEGEFVFLKLQAYRQKSLAKRSNEKLSPRYYGPYKIIQRVRYVA